MLTKKKGAARTNDWERALAVRRDVPREIVEWDGQFVTGDDAEQDWRPCQVFDISPAGAGLELLDTNSEEVRDQSIHLVIHLRGVVKHTQPTDNGNLRVGVEFSNLGRNAREYLKSFITRPTRW